MQGSWNTLLETTTIFNLTSNLKMQHLVWDIEKRQYVMQRFPFDTNI